MNIKRNGQICALLQEPGHHAALTKNKALLVRRYMMAQGGNPHNIELHILMPRNYVAEMGYHPQQHVDNVHVEYKLSPTMKLKQAWGV